MLKDFVTYNGISIPAVGLGTWQSAPNDCYNAVRWALEAGYRHVDTAFDYLNEQAVGKALRDSGLGRDEYFVTTKLPADVKDAKLCEQRFFQSLNNLGTDHIDLYLIHAPWPWDQVGKDFTEGNIAVWEQLLEFKQKGLVREVGVSNFEISHIQAISRAVGVMPAVDQIYHFVGVTEPELREYCQQNGIVVEAYSPLGTGRLLSDERLTEIARGYGVSVAQLCIRYCLHKNTLPLPKSVHRERIAQNISLDFDISERDIEFLDGLEGKTV